MLETDRVWMDVHLTTMSAMKNLFESRELSPCLPAQYLPYTKTC